jgi:hypothetical protein
VKATNNQNYDASSIETPSTVVPDRFFLFWIVFDQLSTKTILGLTSFAMSKFTLFDAERHSAAQSRIDWLRIPDFMH